MGVTRSCSTVQETLRPLLTSMKLFGLYHDITDNINIVRPSPTLNVHKPRTWKKVFNSGTYSLVVVLSLWFNFIRFCVGLLPRDPGFTSRLIFLGWYGMCATNATVMYFACQRLINIPAFIKHWNNLFDDLLTSQGSCERRFSKKYVAVATVIAWLLFIFNNVGILYLLNGNLEEARGFRSSLVRPFPECIVVLVLCSFMTVIETAAWIFPIVFLITVSYTIKLNFDTLSSSLGKHINESKNEIPTQLRCFRRRHLRLCESVSILDKVIKYLLAVCFPTILLSCFILYQIINTTMDALSLTMHIFWLCVGAGTILAASISTSQVNDAAHSPLDHIFKIQTQGASIEDIGQLNLFVAKLTGTTVGFTVLNIFVVTKEVILMIGGSFITYFFILLQFKIN